jgi:hypothetical protein
MTSTDDFLSPYPTARRHSRFELKFPVSLNFESQGVVRELQAVSENVSIKGLLLKVRDRVPPRTSVSLTMEVRGPWFHRPVRLVAKGVVVRSEPLRTADGFALAIECQRPLVEMKIAEDAEARISGTRNLSEAI